MSLKAVLFDFNGVIINDEAIHEQLIEEIITGENLRPDASEFREVCLGRSDRSCLQEILTRRGRIVTPEYLTQLIAQKSQAYQHQLEEMEKLPIFPGLEDLIFKLRVAQLPMGVVSGAQRREVELVINRANLAQYFCVIVAGDDIKVSKPEPDGYLLAVEKINQQYPTLNLHSHECLAIEDTPAGIEAAKRAGMQVVGVANTYPFHMLQRQTNWTVDNLNDLELERVQQAYSEVSS
ncbi:MAG: HAD family phosphatase [Symploca sp. SIO2D2]|nr:HAD family phosphatase [Symploca sp. SIO2D2]